MLCLLCLDSSFVDGWVLNIRQTSHERNVMHNGTDKVCVRCSAQWDCLRGRCHIILQRYTWHPQNNSQCAVGLFEGAGVTLFWIGWEHDLSPRNRLTSSADTNTDHCHCIDDNLTVWREPYHLSISMWVTEIFLSCGNIRNPELEFFKDQWSNLCYICGCDLCYSPPQ